MKPTPDGDRIAACALLRLGIIGLLGCGFMIHYGPADTRLQVWITLAALWQSTMAVIGAHWLITHRKDQR